MSLHTTQRNHVGPSARGYEVGSVAWWACAIRLNYRSAREALGCVRYWATRITEHMAMSEAKLRRSKRRTALLFSYLFEAIERAKFWREQARNTRLARNTRIRTLGPLTKNEDTNAR